MFVMGPCVVVSICTNIILSVVKVCSHQTHADREVDLDVNFDGPSWVRILGLVGMMQESAVVGTLEVPFERDAMKEGVCTPGASTENVVGRGFRERF